MSFSNTRQNQSNRMAKKPDYSKLKPHPLGAMFPPMGDEEYKQLKLSIKTNGFDESQPIWLYEGAILDGNHRHTASKQVKVQAYYREYPGDDPIGFVVARNLARRNLTTSQAAALGAELVEKAKEIEKAEKERLKQAAKAAKDTQQPRKGAKAPKPATGRSKGKKAAAAAKQLGVSERSIKTAAALKRDNPAAFEEVRSGKKSLNAATTDTAIKKSAADRAGDAFSTAVSTLTRVTDGHFAKTAQEKLSSKEVVKLSELDEDEIHRIQPFIESGWKLKDALGYKSATLTMAHPIRALVDRAIAQGGNFTLEAEAYGQKWDIEVKTRKD